METQNFVHLVLFQNLKLKIVDAHQTLVHQPEVPFRGGSTVWWCSVTFFPFNL